MKYVWLSFYILIFSKDLIAHKSNEAFFTFKQKNHVIEVEVEFPWTIRNALIQFNPELEITKNENHFEATFVKYIKKNLVLTDQEGVEQPFIEFKELENNNGHSHGNNFLLKFKGYEIVNVKNTMMFNLYDNQINYNKIDLINTNKSFITKMASPNFSLNKIQVNHSWWYFIVVLIFVLVGLVSYPHFIKNKISSN